MLSVLSALFMVSSTQGKVQWAPLGAAEQLFSPKAIAAVRASRHDLQGQIWPSPSEARYVQANKISPKLVAEAHEWMNRVVANKCLPSMKARALVGLRGTKFPDTIALRYELPNGERVQILDEETRLLVTIDTGDKLLGGKRDDDIDAVREVLLTHFRFPNGRLAKAKFTSGTTVAPNGTKFFQATVKIDAEEKAIENLAWWNLFWINGTGTTYTVVFRKSLGDGKQGTHAGSPGPTYKGRFGDIGK